MNEEQKNIETCLPENILSEVANVPTDPQFRSLVEESFDPLKQQALQQAGCDPYKAKMYHQPYTFTSQVKQMKSNLILLLRRLWRFPFGRGTTASSDAGSSAASAAGSSAASAAAPIRSLADMWQHYITRLKGNPEYGIPSRLDQLTDLPDAPALLADRKIGGVIGAPDGMSLAQLLCSTSAASSVTEIVDTNKGWAGRKSLDILTKNLSALKRIQCNAVEWASGVNILQSGVIEEISLPYLEKINQNGFNLLNIENIELPSVKSILIRIYSGKEGGGNVFSNASKIKHISLPVCESLIVGNYLRSFCRNNSLQETLYMPNCSLVRAESDGMSINNNPMLHTVVFGILKEFNTSSTQQVLGECPNLVHLEIQGAEASINLRYWSPTTALSERLPEFLSNFKTYIAERLTDNGSGLTLTLSQEVRNAIHAAESTYGIENIIITQKGWTISPAPN